MLKHVWQRWVAIFLLCWGCSACGGAVDGPRMGMKLQLLNSNEVKSIRFLDLAIFDGDKVDCGQITPKNYLEDVEPLQSARKKPVEGSNDPVFPLDVKDGKANLAKGLLVGNNLVVFVMALALDGSNQKKQFAYGCIGRVNLLKGKTTLVPIKLSAIK